MNDVRLVVKRSARRLGLDRASRLLARGFVSLAAFICLAILADRLFFLGAPVFYAVAAAAGVTVVAVVILSCKRWPTPLSAAIELDERLRLSERLSSALAVEASGESMAQAVVEDARAYARSVPVASTFPLRFHREYWGVLGLAVMALALSSWMPQYDLLARKAEQEKVREEREDVQRQARKMKKQVQELKRYVELHGPEEAEAHIERMTEVIRAMEAGTMKRAEAMARLSDLAKSLKDARDALAGKNLVPKGMMRKAGLKVTRNLAQAMQQKQYKQAAEELQKLSAQAETDQKLSEEQLARFRQNLEDLIKKLQQQGDTDLAEKLAELVERAKGEQLSQEELEKLKQELGDMATKATAQRGAGDLPEDMKELLEKLGELQNAQQRLARLRNELAQLSQALSNSEALCQALSQMSRSLSEGDMEGLARALSAAQLQFDELEQLEGELAVLKAAQGMCRAGQQGLAKRILATHDSSGIYSPGDSRTPGPGMGGPGIGRGGMAPVAPEDVDFESTKVKGKIRPGRVLSSYFEDGVQVKGEVRVEYDQAVETAAREAAEAVDREEIPRAYKKHVREYFQALKSP